MIYGVAFFLNSFLALFWALSLWRIHKPGERLWYVAMGEVLCGPIPIGVMLLDSINYINLDASMTGLECFVFWTGVFAYFILPAIIGEYFNL